MDNCGVSETNDPNLSVVWEQYGNAVQCVIVHKDGSRPVPAPFILNGPAARIYLQQGEQP